MLIELVNLIKLRKFLDWNIRNIKNLKISIQDFLKEDFSTSGSKRAFFCILELFCFDSGPISDFENDGNILNVEKLLNNVSTTYWHSGSVIFEPSLQEKNLPCTIKITLEKMFMI